jgi:NAD(P)-dependent dehydrogenase (short-subunit alcohol dehydrogenase family)
MPSPGFINTPHQGDFLNDPAQRRKIEQLHLAHHATRGRRRLALFLASEESRFMTGGIHVVDPGYTAFKAKLDLEDVFRR